MPRPAQGLAPVSLALACALAVALALVATGAVAAAAPNAPAPAADVDAAGRYRACVANSARDAADALKQALAWSADGGGAPAEHCAALAEVELGQLAEAAQRLEAAAPKAGRDDLAAGLYGQAGAVWLMQGSVNKADSALSRSIALAPDQPDTRIDRARARAELDDWRAAKSDLDAALRLAPDRAEAYYLRAAAERRLDDLAAAREDIETAVALSPDDAQFLLERGAIRALMNDPTGAREDWTAVLRRADTGPLADAARANLEALDVKPE